jgi:two-component system, LytTR family, response regulator
MIKAIIIDDEKSSRDALNNYIIKYCRDVKIEAHADGVDNALKIIQEVHPDLVFLDIEMKDGLGFDLLNKIEKIDFRIIFVSGFEKYAVKAFKYSASDYLTKPVNITELVEAVEKVKKEINLQTEVKNTKVLMDIINHKEKEIRNIVITDLKGFKILELDDIIICQADGSCTLFNLIGNSNVSSSKNLGHFGYLLENSNFIQVHKSYYINLKHIKGYTSSTQTILLSENMSVPLGDTYRAKFLQYFGRK